MRAIWIVSLLSFATLSNTAVTAVTRHGSNEEVYLEHPEGIAFVLGMPLALYSLAAICFIPFEETGLLYTHT